MIHPIHREVHFWREDLLEPACATLEDRFEWSDAIEDVTCPDCRLALAGDSGGFGGADDDAQGAEPSAP